MKKYTDQIVRESIREVTLNKYKLSRECKSVDTYLPINAYAKGIEDGIQLVFETMADKREEV